MLVLKLEGRFKESSLLGQPSSIYSSGYEGDRARWGHGDVLIFAFGGAIDSVAPSNRCAATEISISIQVLLGDIPTGRNLHHGGK